ncbi:hypothetical protein ACLOJK_000253 [Asimina triloba]
MASVRKGLKVPPNSATLDEARRRTFDFFKAACRSIPSIMEIYNLRDVVTISQLRRSVSSQIRKNAHITNPKVIPLTLSYEVVWGVDKAIYYYVMFKNRRKTVTSCQKSPLLQSNAHVCNFLDLKAPVRENNGNGIDSE